MAIVLKNQTLSNEPLEATFLPEKGMNMMSFKKGNINIIDPSTKNLFEERFAGFGALIGPHFHRRNPQIIPKIENEELFPHIARTKALGIEDPFTHGIARYAPWQIKMMDDTRIHATLSGKDVWHGVPLASFERQQFTIIFKIELAPDGLHLDLSISSESDSLVGIHYYYYLPEKKGILTSDVQSFYLDQNEKKEIPKDWNFSQGRLVYDLSSVADFTFYPFPNPLEGKILLDAGSYQLLTKYSCQSQENCWQLYHPKDASFVCIEPISAQNPRRPNLTASGVKIHLQIL